MDENVKEFLEDLKRTDTKVLSLDNLLRELKNTCERTFKGTLKANILTPRNGLISIDTFLENLFTHRGQGHFLSNSEIQDLENDTTNYIYDNDLYTINDMGNHLAHKINMDIFINDEGSYLVFFQVYTGENSERRFSSYVATKFDSKDNYENAFLYYSTDYLLTSCTLKTEEGTTLNIEVASRPFDEAYIFVVDNDTMEEFFSENLGYSDIGLDTIKNEVKNYIYSDETLTKKFHIKEFTDYNGTPSVL